MVIRYGPMRDGAMKGEVLATEPLKSVRYGTDEEECFRAFLEQIKKEVQHGQRDHVKRKPGLRRQRKRR